MTRKITLKVVAILLCAYFVTLVLSFAPATTALAQQPTPSDNEVNAIARQLFCPVCENTPLDVCPTTACHQWRELIRQMLAEGKSADEIKQYFVDYYGASVLSEPPASGFNWLIYVVPPVVFLIGVFLLFQAFRSWKKMAKTSEITQLPSTGSVDAQPHSADDDPYISRLEDE